MMDVFLFIALLAALSFLAKNVTTHLSRMLMRLFHKQSITIYLLSFLFLPGVILHELSHLLLANLLFVPTGEVEFFPEIQGREVKMGSVAIAKTDPFRRFFIGVVPVVGGLGVILLAASFLTGPLLSWQSLLLLYIIFQISNTMFSSSKDMEGALGFLLGIGIIGGVLQVAGVPLWAEIVQLVQNEAVLSLFTRMNFFLFFALGLDGFFVLLFAGVSRL